MEINLLKSRKYFWKYVLVLLIWLVIIGVSLQARDRLTERVQSSTNLVNDNTEAGEGIAFYQDRFGSTEGISHIIIISVPDSSVYGNILSPQWRNYTLFLSQYIFSAMSSEGYDGVISEPLVYTIPEMASLPNVQSIASSFISKDNTTGLIYLSSSTLTFDKDEQALKDHVDQIRELLNNVDGLKQFVNQVSGNPSAASFLLPSDEEIHAANRILTGTPANILDTIQVSNESFHQSEIIAAIAIFVILLIVFRSPLGVLIPLIATVAALFPAYLLTSFAADLKLFEVNDFLPAVIAMIGIAVAVDYNLFGLVRYREEYRKRRAQHELNGTWDKHAMRHTRVESARIMNKTAGSAVMYSGFTVVIGFSALLLAGDEFSLGMAIGVSIGVLISILAARSLTPSILALTGNWLDFPSFMSGAKRDIKRQKSGDTNGNGIWVKWSHMVMRRPLVFLLLGLLVLAPFVALATQTELSFSLVKSLPASTESRQGFEILQSKFNLGELNPYQVVIDLGPEVNSALQHADVFTKINEFAQDIMQYTGKYKFDNSPLQFETVNSLSVSAYRDPSAGSPFALNQTEILHLLNTPLALLPPQLQVQKILFEQQASKYLNVENGNNTLIIDITSNLDPGSGEAWQLVDVVENKVQDHFGDLLSAGTVKNVYVTGLTALFKDSSDAMYSRVPLMLGIAVILIFIVLTILFRSVLLPAKAIITIAGSILFGLGSLVFVFQYGNFQHVALFGVTLWEADVVSLTYFIPVFLFTIILGLGMDYSIFIISRIREEYEKGAEMAESVGLGLSKTAGVVTSAATIMTVTFMVFALAPMLILKMMGLAMSIAIVADATIARLILLPSAMKLAGRYNFWLPKWLDKILPKIHLDH